MLTLKLIREEKEKVINRLKVKNFDALYLVDQIILKDNQRRETQVKLDNCLAEANNIAKQVGQLFREGKKVEAENMKARTEILKNEEKSLKSLLETIDKELNQILVQLPNLPDEAVPAGKSAADNIIVRSGGQIPSLNKDKALPHWDLAKKYDIIDFELGVKITGAGFPVYKGKGARLQRALISFFLDKAVQNGYIEVMPPLMVNEDSGFGTGQLPDKEGQMYHVGIDNFYLIPTAEVPVTNIFRDVILNSDDFPVKRVAYTPCFRREAGSYGKDVRGLNRLHQFDKVEIVQLRHPSDSFNALEEMVSYVESLVSSLGLPYRIVKLCGGDMSFTSALTYDFEVYSAAQDKWLEVSSVSNFVDYQANRLKLRFKEKGEKKTQLAHTLNGSALALPRIVAALLENNQTENGISVPEVLIPFMGCDIIN
ncbi:MAG: serine--tRNA ligase [Bacteroidales bacterium]